MRWEAIALCLAASGIVVLADPAMAATQRQASPEEQAYAAALKCFAANAHAGETLREASEPARAAEHDRSARASFDAAVRLGRALGYTNQRVNGDLRQLQSTEMARLVGDTAYFREMVLTCRAMGLMPLAQGG